MSNKIVEQGIAPAKVIETVHLVHLAMATKIIGDAEPVFDAFGSLASKGIRLGVQTGEHAQHA